MTIKRIALIAEWEILQAAEIIEQYAETTKHALARIYTGNAVRTIYSNQVKSEQVWSLSIVTTAKSDNGEIHTHDLKFKFDAPISLSNMVNSVKGLWLDAVDQDLAGMTCLRADAVARCLAVKNK